MIADVTIRENNYVSENNKYNTNGEWYLELEVLIAMAYILVLALGLGVK